jgi:long-chain acyl-CoA synthetase
MPGVAAVAYSAVLAGTERPGHGAIHRATMASANPIVPDPTNPHNPYVGLTRPHAESIYHSFQQAARTFHNQPCLGVQPIIAGEPRDFEWLTYEQVATRIANLASGLMQFDLLPYVERTRMVAIYMKNSIDWVIAEQAAYSFNATVVALYDTLGTDSTIYILNQTQLPTIVCTLAELAKLVSLKPSCPHLQHVIVCGLTDDQLETDARAVGLNVHSLLDLDVEGKKAHVPPQPPREHDVATIMYTSGTTGDPKGVVLSHRALLANCQSSVDFINHFGLQFSSDLVYLSYLPLAHIFERGALINALRHGARVGFSSGNPLLLIQDLRALRPTMFCSVPRLLNRVHDQILAKMAAAPPLKKFLFFTALKTKLRNLAKHGRTRHSWWDKILFNRIAEGLGLDRCAVIFSGSAPLSADVLAFWRVVFPALVAEGYGQTETSSGITASHLTDLSGGYVGGPSTACEIKLESVPDMGYLVEDREHGDTRLACVGRGEICVRGPILFDGYFKLPEKTAEAIDADGWLHTGDIGLWSPLGQLKIIDRKKNIFKLSQGEYVAPEKIEIALQAAPSVAQIFVTGDSFHSHLVAIVVPEELVLRHLAASVGLAASCGFKELCDHSAVVKLVQAELDQAGAKVKLAGFERVKKIYLHHELFSVENGLLTPTFKLRRGDAQKYFKRQIDQLYVESGDAVAGKQITQQ